MTPSVVLGVLLAMSSAASFLGALAVLYANALGSVTAPGSGGMTGTAILALAGVGFGLAAWWSFTS